MGGAFAEVSPDFCFNFNSRGDSRIAVVTSRWVCYCNARCMHACRMGVGAIERIRAARAAYLAGSVVWIAVGGDDVNAARISSRRQLAGDRRDAMGFSRMVDRRVAAGLLLSVFRRFMAEITSLTPSLRCADDSAFFLGHDRFTQLAL